MRVGGIQRSFTSYREHHGQEPHHQEKSTNNMRGQREGESSSESEAREDIHGEI
jgi:hypothetical protein